MGHGRAEGHARDAGHTGYGHLVLRELARTVTAERKSWPRPSLVACAAATRRPRCSNAHAARRLAALADEIDRPELLKQRRLLLSFTFILTAIHLLDVELGGSVTVQGLVLTFKHSWLIVLSLWIAWAWSVWRYWQYESSYRGHTFLYDRMREYDRQAQISVVSALRKAIEQGQYGDRRLRSGEPIHVSDASGGQLAAARGNEKEWEFLNLEVSIGAPAPGMPMRKLDGGANCTLDAQKVTEIKRAVEADLRVKHPYYADWKAPYLLLWLAPISGLIAFGRWLLALPPC